jgi:hypothetical protein
VVWIDGVGWVLGLTSDFAFVFAGPLVEFIFGAEIQSMTDPWEPV